MRRDPGASIVTVINLLALSTIPYVGKLFLEIVKTSLGPKLRSFPNFKLCKRGPGAYVEIVKGNKYPKTF